MKKIIVLVFLTCILLPLLALDDAIKIKEVDSLTDLSYHYICQVDIENSLKYAKQALDLSEEINYSQGKAESNFYIAQTLFDVGSFHESLDYLMKAEAEEFTKKTPLVQFEVDRIKGRIFSHLLLKEQALKAFRNCLVLSDKLPEKAHQDYCKSMTYENLGTFYKINNEYDSMLYYFNLNHQLISTMDESFAYFNKVNVYCSLGESYVIGKNHLLAEHYLLESIHIAEKYDYPYVSKAYMLLGDAEMLIDNHELALSYYYKSKENLDQTKIKGEYSPLYEKLANCYSALNMPDSATFYETKLYKFEYEVTRDKLESANKVFEILMLEEKSSFEGILQKYYIIAIISIIFIVFLIYFLWLWKSKKHTKELSNISLHLTRQQQDVFEELVQLAKTNSNNLVVRFTQLYPNCVHNLKTKHPEITNADLQMCIFIYLNFTTKEIAKYTYLTIRSVQTKRSRLRKKVGLSPDADIYQYIQSLG